MVLAQPLPAAVSDLERVQRARLGDPDALRELITSHRIIVEQVARGFVSDRADIDDIAQETWIRASQALSSLREETRFRPWLRAITRNACLTFLSRRQTCDSLDAQDAPDPADPALDGPEASAEQRDERRRVWEALGALPELDRRALYLREVESLPFEEVARRLGIRRNAAEVRVHRARTRFRQLYEATDVTHPPCGMAGIRLALLLDGELHGEAADAVEQHLRGCSACTQRVRTMAQGRSLYRRMGMFALPGLNGLMERWQRVTEAILRWIPADSVSLLAGNSAGTSAAASGIVTAVVAAAIFAGPSLPDVRAAASEIGPQPVPSVVVAASMPAPSDVTVAVTESSQVAKPLASAATAVAGPPAIVARTTALAPAEEPATGRAADIELPAPHPADVHPPVDSGSPTPSAAVSGDSSSPLPTTSAGPDRGRRAAGEDEKGNGKTNPAREASGKDPAGASIDRGSPRASVADADRGVDRGSSGRGAADAPRNDDHGASRAVVADIRPDVDRAPKAEAAGARGADAGDVQRSFDRPHEAGRAVADHAEEPAGREHGKGHD